MSTLNNAYLLGRIKDIDIDLKDSRKSLEEARKELVDVQEWLKNRELEFKKAEIRLESAQEEYVDENLSIIEDYFGKRYLGTKDNFEASFDRWISEQPFEALRTIVESPRRLRVKCMCGGDSDFKILKITSRPIHDTKKGSDLDDVVKRGEENRQRDAEDGI